MSESRPEEMNRRALLARMAAATLFGSATLQMSEAKAGAHAQGRKIEYPPSDPELFKAIDAVLKRTEEIWRLQEWWRLPTEIWDREDPTPIYVAEELYDVMVGWDILDEYIFPDSKNMDAFRWGYSKLFVKYLAPGVALALYDHWFEIKVRATGPLSRVRRGDDRVLSIYNLRDDGWRQSLYAQCPLGPDTYVQRMSEDLVSDDWDEFYESIKSNDIDDPRLKKD